MSEIKETVVTTQTLVTTSQVAQNTREWTTPVTGCFTDVKSCVCGFFCMPCLLCKIASRMDEACCVPFCVPGGIIALRTKLRTMYGIKGTICNDCLCSMCLPPCVACQMDRELTNLGK